MTTKTQLRNAMVVALLSVGSFSNIFAQDTPTTAAPSTEEYDASKVISIFSDVYTDTLKGTFFNPIWWDAQKTQYQEIEIAGNKTIEYSTLDMKGIEIATQVLSGNYELHFNLWTKTGSEVSVALVNKDGFGQNNTTLQTIALNPTLGEWNTYKISLQDFMDLGMYVNSVFQIIFNGNGDNTIYIDNLYFVNVAVAETEMPSVATVSVIDTKIESVTLKLNATDNSGSVTYKIEVDGKTFTTIGASGANIEYVITGLKGGTNYTINVTTTDDSGNDNTTATTVTATTLPALDTPTVGAPEPKHSASSVISIYSDAYTPVRDNINFNPWWNQSTIQSFEEIAGNNTMVYKNLNYQGIEFGADVDLTSMTHLHVDVWTPNVSGLRITPVMPGSEQLTAIPGLQLGEWISVDIPLSTFAAISDWTKVFQMKFDGGSGENLVFIDNIYFHNGDVTSINSTADNQKAIYPNPTSGVIFVDAQEGEVVSVYSITGQLVKDAVVSNGSVSISELNNGFYLVKVNGKSQSILKK